MHPGQEALYFPYLLSNASMILGLQINFAPRLYNTSSKGETSLVQKPIERELAQIDSFRRSVSVCEKIVFAVSLQKIRWPMRKDSVRADSKSTDKMNN